jgi:membrane protein DedA with SNARE-associated domain
VFEWIAGVMAAGGLWGVAFLMLAENVFPPIPSEAVMPLAGFLAAQGRLPALGVVLAGTAGSVAGATLWYLVGRAWGEARFHRFVIRWGHWFTISPQEAERAVRWFRSRGGWAVCLGRLVPAVRTVISVPAGIAGMPFPAFLGWTTLGSLIWVSLLTAAGYLLEANYHAVAAWLDPATTVVLGLVALAYVWRVWRLWRRR